MKVRSTSGKKELDASPRFPLANRGGMAERPKAVILKTTERKLRGFFLRFRPIRIPELHPRKRAVVLGEVEPLSFFSTAWRMMRCAPSRTGSIISSRRAGFRRGIVVSSLMAPHLPCAE